jgi:hypothetical protein
VGAFNLDQQVEIFRQDEFDAAGYTKLAESLDHLRLEIVPESILEKPKGYAALLANMVNAEFRSSEPADAVIFLGSQSRFTEKMPDAMLDRAGRPHPHFFYLNFRSYGDDWPDTIERLVKDLDGQALHIRDPRELASGILQLNRTETSQSR